MPSPTRVTQSLCAALLAAAVLVGCGGAEKDSAGGGKDSTTKPTAEGKPSAASDSDRDYYGCLEKNGVKIETTPDGELRVVKTGGNEAALTKAEAECADLLPDTPKDTGETANADPAFAACMKAEGFAEYKRDDIDDKDALVAAVEKCSHGKNDGQDPVVGG
ncbi:hypothetical protein ABZS83_14915 [Streptomyces sp. NPDC005426]|uniref:hypothetical protein n=1 Tax=Streptomyces sp. NPDC005426 TaxID=3155344 RepID=UPI0033B5C8E1